MATGILGLDALGTFLLGAGVNTLSDDQIDVAYLLVIEGIAQMFVTDHTDDVLLGSGSNSWIGQYEQDPAYTAHETVGQRVVVGGLKIPEQLSRGSLNPKTGQLETTQATFEILDVDDILPGLFASEGKEFDVLGERVPPGTAALDNTLTIEGLASVDPLGRYIGNERIGPARERAWFYPFPFQGIGAHHQVNVNAPEDAQGPPPVRVSEQPLEFAGRKVALYKLYRNGSGPTASRDDWAHWGDQAQIGPPEWFGVMRDGGEYRGDRVWRIQCFGPESLTRRRMSTFDMGGAPISTAGLTLTDEQAQIAVAFYTFTDASGTDNYNSIEFGTATLPLSGSKADYAEAIRGVITDAGDGTTGDFGGGNPIFDEDFGGSKGVSMSVGDTGVISIERSADGTEGLVFARLAVHERVWRRLGFEPALQSVSWAHAPSKLTEVVFQSLEAGEGYADADNGGFGQDGTDAPGPGYWVGVPHTAAINHSPQGAAPDDRDNSGAAREFHPLFDAQPIILGRPANDQPIGLNGTFPYLEGDPTIDAGAFEAARFFVLTGQRAVGDITDAGQIFTDTGELVEDLEAEPFGAVVELRWNLEGTGYGSISQTTGPEMVLHRWISSRRFGVDHDDLKLSGEWSALPQGDYQITATPVHAYAYRETADQDSIERAPMVFGQLLLSTGTAAGWSGNSYTFGANAPAGSPASSTRNNSSAWINDVAGSELGLGIPHQLVQSPESIIEAFDEVEGGAHGPINRVRVVYPGPFASQDLLDSLLRTRGLAMSLRDGRFGVTKLGLFEPALADAVIDDSSVALQDPEDPSSIPTTQQIRATGGLDVVELQASLDPTTGELAYQQVLPARDPGARFRRGDIEEQIDATGLLDPSWNIGGSTWLGAARELHSVERARWLNQRHFLIRTSVHRLVGESLWPGSRVLFTSERVYTAAGQLGMSSALGHILNVDPRPRDQEYDIELIVYAGQLRLPLFAPIGKLSSAPSGTSVTLVPDADFLDHGDGLDGDRFENPTQLSTESGARVCLLGYDRRTWTLYSADTDTVASSAGHVVSLDNGFAGSYHANHDYYLVCVGYDDQDADSWPRAGLMPYVLDTLQFGTGPTDGWPYLDA